MVKDAGMKTIKNIISGILVLMIIIAGMSFNQFGSPPISMLSGLKNAVTNMKDFVRTAERPDDFNSQIQKTLTALRVAAELKTILKSGSQGKIHQVQDLIYLLSAKNNCGFFNSYVSVFEKILLYGSFTIQPEPRPPRLFA